jgi:hypothetical protein
MMTSLTVSVLCHSIVLPDVDNAQRSKQLLSLTYADWQKGSHSTLKVKLNRSGILNEAENGGSQQSHKFLYTTLNLLR